MTIQVSFRLNTARLKSFCGGVDQASYFSVLLL